MVGGWAVLKDIASSDALGHRPDVLLRVDTYGGIGQDTARVPSSTQTAAVGTEVYIAVRVGAFRCMKGRGAHAGLLNTHCGRVSTFPLRLMHP